MNHYENYRDKALHDGKMEELKERYVNQGFELKKDEPDKDKPFDFVLRHKEHGNNIAFEVKLAPISMGDLEHLEWIKGKAEEAGYGFRLITVHKSTRPKIELNWLRSKFFDFLAADVPAEIQEKSVQPLISNVEVSISSIGISDSIANVSTGGIIETKAQVEDNDVEESFPFVAKMTLDLSRKTIEDVKITIDDSVAY